MKTIFKTAACAMFLCMTFTACDNFMNGTDIKDEIISAIDYNNAKSISILVQPATGTGVTVPSGNYSVKQGYEFELSFSEASAWCFEEWKAVTNDGKKTPVTNGVYFENPKSLTTKAIIQNNTDSILIIPECKERITLDGEPTPKYNSLGESRDSPIVVTFKQKLAPSSFEFSQDEIPAGAQKKETNGKIWAYTLNDQTFFKNISITNSDGYSMAEYFTRPKIDETGKMLTIGTNIEKLIPFSSNETLKTIVVTLSENIQNEEHISMGSPRAWRYLINETTNEKAYTTVSADNGAGSLDGPAAGSGFSINQTITISFTVNEGFKFEQWSASSESLPDTEDINDYVVFGDINSPSTTVTFLKPLYDLRIVAECPALDSFVFNLTGSNGKFSPVKGEQKCIQSFSYPVSFEPDRDYEFLEWEIYDSVTNEVFENGDYLTLENPKDATTTYSFAAIPGSEVKLALRPVIADRPQIISNSPTGSGAYKDSTIQILFDTDMDPGSIYFTGDEIKTLKAEGITQLLLVGANEPQNIVDVLRSIESGAEPKVYGYLKNEETYFKNIMIRNKNTQKNITNCFLQPFFENPSTLSISAYKLPEDPEEQPDPIHKVLDDYTQILVCLEKGFFYTVENDTHVEMAGSRKWMYQVNSKTDTDPMIIQKNEDTDKFSVSLVEGANTTPVTAKATLVIGNEEEQTKTSQLNYLNGKKFKLDFTIKDPATSSSGSGPSDYFIVNLKRIYNSNYEKITPEETARTNIVYYHNYNSSEATYDGIVDMSTWTNIEDGVYAMNFTFYDRSNNSCTYPESGYYYITLDSTGPAITTQSAVRNTDTVSTFTTSWATFADLKQTQVFYKKSTDTEWISSGAPVTELSKVVTAPEENGIKVDFKFVYEDYNGNKSDQVITEFTEIANVSGIHTTNRSNTWVTIAWDAPESKCDGFECDGYLIYYTTRDDYDRPLQKEIRIDNKNTTTVTIPYGYRDTDIANDIEKVDIKIKAKYQNYYSEELTYSTLTGFIIQVSEYVNGMLWYINSNDNDSFKMYESTNQSYWRQIPIQRGGGIKLTYPSNKTGTIYLYAEGTVTKDGVTETVKSDIREFTWSK